MLYVYGRERKKGLFDILWLHKKAALSFCSVKYKAAGKSLLLIMNMISTALEKSCCAAMHVCDLKECLVWGIAWFLRMFHSMHSLKYRNDLAVTRSKKEDLLGFFILHSF